MTTRTQRAVVAAVSVLAAGLAWTAITPAAASPTSAVVERVTIRLASDPGQVVNVKGASTDNGAQLIQWHLSQANNERWEPESLADGYYRFRSVSSGKCVNVKGASGADSAPIIQYTCGRDDNELWSLVRKGIGYQLVAKSSGKCLNVKGGVGEGRDLIQYTCTTDGAANDVWLVVWETVTR